MGYIIRNGTNYSSDNSVTLTQAQYDDLVQAGTVDPDISYYISDSTTALLTVDMIYPIGSIFMSVNNVNPGNYLSGTTWVAWGAGRVPVGVDTTQTEFDTVEETGGAKSVTLTGAQSGIQAHKHTFAGNITSTEASGYGLTVTGGFSNRVLISSTSAKSSTIVENVAAKNATSSHTNLQPYITCYMWKRTS